MNWPLFYGAPPPPELHYLLQYLKVAGVSDRLPPLAPLQEGENITSSCIDWQKTPRIKRGERWE